MYPHPTRYETPLESVNVWPSSPGHEPTPVIDGGSALDDEELGNLEFDEEVTIAGELVETALDVLRVELVLETPEETVLLASGLDLELEEIWAVVEMTTAVELDDVLGTPEEELREDGTAMGLPEVVCPTELDVDELEAVATVEVDDDDDGISVLAKLLGAAVGAEEGPMLSEEDTMLVELAGLEAGEDELESVELAMEEADGVRTTKDELVVNGAVSWFEDNVLPDGIGSVLLGGMLAADDRDVTEPEA